MENRVKEIRNEMGMSQETFAKMIGLSRPALSQIENGQTTPGGDTIARMVKETGRKAEEIFFELAVVQKQQNDEPA